ncbi:MAG: hypothetical protein R2692_02195 [Microbacterium sp.]
MQKPVRAALRAERVLGRSADLYTFASIVVDQATDTITVQADGDPWRALGRVRPWRRKDA